MLAEGRTIAEIAKRLEVSEQTYHRWRNTYGGLKGPEMKRLKELERENAQLKRLVADCAAQRVSVSSALAWRSIPSVRSQLCLWRSRR